MITYRPLYGAQMGQNGGAVPAPAPAEAAAPPAAPAAPVVAPVVMETSYTGVPGFLETVAVLSVAAAAAWTGVRVGMNKNAKQLPRVAGWVGGVGSALIGLLYLGSKTGVTRSVALPQVQVVPA